MSTFIYTADTIKAWDAFSIRQQKISTLQLMEQAALACVAELLRLLPDARSAFIVAGAGNNGGDGLAMARLLSERNWKVSLYRIPAERYSEDNAEQWKRMPLNKIRIVDSWDAHLANQHDVTIDALMGIGVNRQLTGLLATVVHELNTAACPTVSIDLPTGMPAELAFESAWPVVRATRTFTLGSYKLNLLLPHAAPFVGDLSFLDIGLSRDFAATTGVIGQVPSLATLAQLLPKRGTFSHKGHFGHALLIAGSEGKLGAAVLAGKACMRSGSGLTTLAVPLALQGTLATALPEAMSLNSGTGFWSNHIIPTHYTAVGIGPGLGTEKRSAQALIQLLATATCPLLLDADALNLLATYPGGIALIPKGTILTPHVKEFDRLFGPHSNWWSRLETLQAVADSRGFIIVLKNAFTFIAAPHATLRVNLSGNPGLAKGGSGDVLTGIITSLMAQGIPAASAAILGVWVHGSSADLAVKQFGETTLLASDVIDCIPETIVTLNFHQTN